MASSDDWGHPIPEMNARVKSRRLYITEFIRRSLVDMWCVYKTFIKHLLVFLAQVKQFSISRSSNKYKRF